MVLQKKDPKCKCCGERFKPLNNNYFQKFCKNKDKCISAQKDWNIKEQTRRNLRDRNNAKKLENKKKQEGYKPQINHGDWENKLQPLINRIAKLLDKGCNCMMCDTPLPEKKQKDACHYHSVGANNSIRFNLLNIYIGCRNCNGEVGGNIAGFDNMLIQHFGKEYREFVKFDLVRLNPYIKISSSEFPEIIKKSSFVIRTLEKENKVYSLSDRIEKRHKINDYLGIFPL